MLRIFSGCVEVIYIEKDVIEIKLYLYYIGGILIEWVFFVFDFVQFGVGVRYDIYYDCK